MIEKTITADALDGLKTLESESVDMCVTSPPYFGLRDYGVDGQIGLEPTPEAYIERLVDVFREVRRVLKNDGTLWVIIGDSYAGSRKGGATHPENAGNYMQGTNRGLVGRSEITKVGWGSCKPKDLIGIPWMLAFALRTDGWYLRQDIVWNKSNPMPESVTDRCTKSHEYIFLLSKSQRYHFDSKRIREPRVGANNDPIAGSAGTLGCANSRLRGSGNKARKMRPSHKALGIGEQAGHIPYAAGESMRNKRDVWTVSKSASKSPHFATFPPDLIRPCILAGCRKGGTVLDPFFGSGTTGVVAMQEQRGYIGIELNAEYSELAEKRLRNTMTQLKLTDI